MAVPPSRRLPCFVAALRRKRPRIIAANHGLAGRLRGLWLVVRTGSRSTGAAARHRAIDDDFCGRYVVLGRVSKAGAHPCGPIDQCSVDHNASIPQSDNKPEPVGLLGGGRFCSYPINRGDDPEIGGCRMEYAIGAATGG